VFGIRRAGVKQGIHVEGHVVARQKCLLRALANKQIPGSGLPFFQLLVANPAIVQ
jgi:hypothetical protein